MGITIAKTTYCDCGTQTRLMEEKKSVRKQLLAKLLSVTQEEIERRSKNVENIIRNMSIYKQAKVIMVYYPLRGEVNLLGIVREVLGKKDVCFPVIDAQHKNLNPYIVTDLKNDFVPGPWGVMQPDTTKTRLAPMSAIDVIFVPGIGFDRGKNRLGRGGGFYDRFLKRRSKHTIASGVAFDFQILPNLPSCVPHDEKVDLIVSETNYF